MYTQKNRLNETVLLSTQNIYLKLWVRKYLQFYAEILVYLNLWHCFHFGQSEKKCWFPFTIQQNFSWVGQSTITYFCSLKKSGLAAIKKFQKLKFENRRCFTQLSETDFFVLVLYRFDSLRPINNLSVKQGWVFLG